MPQQIPQLAPRLKAMGFQGDPQAFADLTGQPMGAIVSLGGCSASFVSPDGLIVTNNHCVQGALQYNSKPERNLMVDGYLAKTRADELWNGPGSRVYVTVSVKDVTEDIARQARPEARGPPALRRHRAARQGEDGRVREGRPALLGRAVLRGPQVVRARPDGDPGRAARLRAAGRHRKLRRRDGQLAVAPPHGRLVLLPRLRLEGREGRAVLEGERPVQAEALAQGLAGGREPRRPRLRGRLSGAHGAPLSVRGRARRRSSGRSRARSSARRTASRSSRSSARTTRRRPCASRRRSAASTTASRRTRASCRAWSRAASSPTRSAWRRTS